MLGFSRDIIPNFLKTEVFEVTLRDQTGLANTYLLVVKYEERFEGPFDRRDPRFFKKDCSAKIKSINMWGEMVVQFNSTMNPRANVTLLNKTTVDIYVEPYFNDYISQIDRLK